jgi:hypothetical protein
MRAYCPFCQQAVEVVKTGHHHGDIPAIYWFGLVAILVLQVLLSLGLLNTVFTDAGMALAITLLFVITTLAGALIGARYVLYFYLNYGDHYACPNCKAHNLGGIWRKVWR